MWLNTTWCVIHVFPYRVYLFFFLFPSLSCHLMANSRVFTKTSAVRFAHTTKTTIECITGGTHADVDSKYGSKLTSADIGPECVQCGSAWTQYWRRDVSGHFLCSSCVGGYYRHKMDDIGRLLQTRGTPPNNVAVPGKQLLNLPAVSVNCTQRFRYSLCTVCCCSSILKLRRDFRSGSYSNGLSWTGAEHGHEVSESVKKLNG